MATTSYPFWYAEVGSPEHRAAGFLHRAWSLALAEGRYLDARHIVKEMQRGMTLPPWRGGEA